MALDDGSANLACDRARGEVAAELARLKVDLI